MKMSVISKTQRIGALLFLAAVCCFGSSKAYAIETASPGCQRLSTKTVVSPNGAWEAVVHEDFCEFGYAFTSIANYTVTIITRSDRARQERQGNVFVINSNGHPSYQPVVSWIGQDELLISTRHSRYIGLQKDKFEKIKIQYAYQAPPPLPTRRPTPQPPIPTSQPTGIPTPNICPSNVPGATPNPHPTQSTCTGGAS